MATAQETQTLISAASCDLCVIPSGLIYYAIAAALIDKGSGGSVPSDPQVLIEEAKCLECLVEPGLLPYVILEAVRNL